MTDAIATKQECALANAVERIVELEAECERLRAKLRAGRFVCHCPECSPPILGSMRALMEDQEFVLTPAGTADMVDAMANPPEPSERMEMAAERYVAKVRRDS